MVKTVMNAATKGNVVVKKDSTSISKSVGWINKNAMLVQPINFSEANEALSAIDESVALGLLDELSMKSPTIKDPTAWLKSACNNAAEGRVRKGGRGEASMGTSYPTGGMFGAMGGMMGNSSKISKQIGWMNKQEEMQQPINYNDVIGPLMSIGEHKAIKLLEQLGEKKGDVRDPTGWLKVAAKKDVGRNGMAGSNFGMNPMMAMMMGAIGGMATGGKNRVSKKVGAINKQFELEKPILFRDVSGPLNAMGEGPALKLLEEFEQKSAEIKDPTKWIAAAAARGSWY